MVKSFAGSQKGSTMGYIHCCGGLRKTKSFRLSPQDNFVLCELDYLEKCPVCGTSLIQITRIDKDNNISTIRKSKDKAQKFFDKIKTKSSIRKLSKITSRNITEVSTSITMNTG